MNNNYEWHLNCRIAIPSLHPNRRPQNFSSLLNTKGGGNVATRLYHSFLVKLWMYNCMIESCCNAMLTSMLMLFPLPC